MGNPKVLSKQPLWNSLLTHYKVRPHLPPPYNETCAPPYNESGGAGARVPGGGPSEQPEAEHGPVLETQEDVLRQARAARWRAPNGRAGWVCASPHCQRSSWGWEGGEESARWAYAIGSPPPPQGAPPLPPGSLPGGPAESALRHPHGAPVGQQGLWDGEGQPDEPAAQPGRVRVWGDGPAGDAAGDDEPGGSRGRGMGVGGWGWVC